MRSKQLLSIVFSVILFTGVTAGSVAFAESDEIELKGILSVIDDNTFELETRDGIKKLSINDKTVIDNGLPLRELNGLVVDVDAILIDGVLFATEIEFDSENLGDDKQSKSDRKLAKEEAKRIEKQAKEDAKRDEKQAKEDAKRDEKQAKADAKRDEKQAKEDAKRDEKQAKADAKRAEKLAKHDAKLLKAETRLAEKIAELEKKLTERANISQERANKILDKITKETQKYDDRVLKLVDKFQSGKYFGDNTNTDKETKSFTLSFEGTAAEIGDQSTIETLSGEIFLENLLTGSHSKKFRVTGGSIFIAEETGNDEVFDIIFGKARLSSSGQGGEKDSMILIAQTDDGANVRTLRLSIDLTEEFTEDTESAGIEILFPRSKIASLWFLSATGELKLTVDDPPAPSVTTSDGTTPPLDDTPPADIPETITLTVTTEQDSYTTGDEIIISGTVGEIIPDLPVVLQIKTATDLIGIAQIVPEADGTFTHFILADGPLWLVDNTITVKAFYGGNNVAEITLEFTA